MAGEDEGEKMSGLMPEGSPQRVIESTQLFDGDSEICIRHDGALYRLKITRQGKLILNK